MIQKLLAGFAIILGSAGAASGADHEVEKATAVAESWLALTDAGKYDDGWEAAATFMRGAVTKERFTDGLTAARTPLGPTQSRKLLTANHTRHLPGAPDGDYVVIQFETVFKNKAHAIETVTPMKEKDGSWRVSGYFIK
jgi:hypothetical protein